MAYQRPIKSNKATTSKGSCRNLSVIDSASRAEYKTLQDRLSLPRKSFMVSSCKSRSRPFEHSSQLERVLDRKKKNMKRGKGGG